MADVINIEIDGKALEAKPGVMIIQVADQAGIYIPRFCYHQELSIAANCRMCLVEVEKAPKPLPACATPVADGMKVFTGSAVAVEAQKGTMEFLLINHPLDCPICDQGGECPLQDQALGYGKDVSRFTEKKRVVDDHDIGPLISTEMTRCIHCTRCVRFGAEIGGIMEMGATGRGEHMEIGTYLGRTVDSELSGNMIDLCPVGALTSKPYRYTARAWELVSHDAVSPHDCVGSNMSIQSLRGEVKRVLPRENEAVNQCWLSDRDRYSYEALNTNDRLSGPKIREHGQWREVDWHTALEFTVAGLRNVIEQHGAHQLGALASPTSTLEEFYLLQKFMRSLGSGNVDHRLRQADYTGDDIAPDYPGLGRSIQSLKQVQAALLIGSNIRKEQPLLGLRLRKAFLAGAKISAINAMDYDFTFDLSNKCIVNPATIPLVLARVAKALSSIEAKPLPAEVERWLGGDGIDGQHLAIATTLHQSGDSAVIVGTAAQSHPQHSVIRALAQLVADLSGATFGVLPEANGAGGWLAGCVPHRGSAAGTAEVRGMNARQMLQHSLKAFILLGVEPELDCLDGCAARKVMEAAEFVVSFSAFETEATEYSHVQLPIAAFSETPGSYVNCEGLVQSVQGAVAPPGEARPAWKVLRVLGNLFELPGFDYVDCEEVRAELESDRTFDTRLRSLQLEPLKANQIATNGGLERIWDVPIYVVDPVVRRAPALRATSDNGAPCARVNPEQLITLGVTDGDTVTAELNGGSVDIIITADSRVPQHCVHIPAGYPETAALGGTGQVRIVGK